MKKFGFLFLGFVLFNFQLNAMEFKQKKDYIEEYFAKNNINKLLSDIQISAFWPNTKVLKINKLTECSDSNCSLKRAKSPLCRRTFEDKVLLLFNNSEFIQKIQKTKTIRITDFASGGLFQTFIVVRKVIDKAMLVFKNKINIVIDIIDPVYNKADRQEITKQFKDYFSIFYKNKSKILFTLNVLTDACDLKLKSFDFAHIVICADFDNVAKKNRVTTKLPPLKKNKSPIAVTLKTIDQDDCKVDSPAKFLKKLYNDYPKNNSFWFCFLAKSVLKDLYKFNLSGPTIYFGKITKKSGFGWDYYIMKKSINVIPFYRERFMCPFTIIGEEKEFNLGKCLEYLE